MGRRAKVHQSPAVETQNNAVPANGKLPGIFEAKRIGTHGIVFASFRSGVQFWVQFSKTTPRREVIDLFNAHKDQYPWMLGREVKIPGEPSIWKYEAVPGLQYLKHSTGKIHNVESIERVKDEKKSRDQGRAHYEWFLVDDDDERVEIRIGEGLFGQLKMDCVVPNVQDVQADAARSLWPNRTMNLQHLYGEDSVFSQMGMQPVDVAATAKDERGYREPIEGVKMAGVESGKLENPITGVFVPGAQA